MKKTILLFAVTAVLVSTGCASDGSSKGAVTVLHWDSRSAEQLQACAGQDNPVFADTAVAAQTEKAVPVGWWDALMKMITGIRVRIDIIRVEWNVKPTPAKPTASVCSDCEADDLCDPSLEATNFVQEATR